MIIRLQRRLYYRYHSSIYQRTPVTSKLHLRLQQRQVLTQAVAGSVNEREESVGCDRLQETGRIVSHRLGPYIRPLVHPLYTVFHDEKTYC